MAIYRPTYTKPLPPGAELFERGGERLARWTDHRGRKQTAPVITRRDGSPGIRLTSARYIAEVGTGAGTVQRKATGCRDRGAAANVEGEMQKRRELVRAGVISAEQDAVADATALPLAVHLDAYRAHLTETGRARDYIAGTVGRFTRIIEECRFERLPDMKGAVLDRWLSGQAAAGMSAATRNSYRASAINFTSWAIRTGRLLTSPFGGIGSANVATDRRHVRRAMTPEEIGRFLTVAALRPLAELGRQTVTTPRKEGKRAAWTYAPLTWEAIHAAADEARKRLEGKPGLVADLEARGRERALIYRILLLPGFRKSELAAIRLVDLDLEATPATLTLAAANEKARRGAVIQLRADLAADLRAWVGERLQTLQAGARLAGKPSAHGAAGGRLALPRAGFARQGPDAGSSRGGDRQAGCRRSLPGHSRSAPHLRHSPECRGRRCEDRAIAHAPRHPRHDLRRLCPLGQGPGGPGA